MRRGRRRYRLTPYNRIQFFAFNYHRPLFADIRMRRAVQYALDRRALVEASPSGSAAPGDPPVYRASWARQGSSTLFAPT